MATASETTAPDGVIGPTARQTAGAGQGDLAVGRWDPGAEEPSKSDRYLARRLAAASADFKSVACTTFLLGAAVAGGAWLAVGILAEHWLVPGGLSPPIRWAWLGIALVAFIAAAVRWLVPLVRYRVNLVYAARAIEREHPELHNDLVNTVLVKAHRESNPEKVVRSLERRTAKQLAEVPVEAVIDRTVPLRLAWVLAALVGLAGLYELAAPKSLLVTAARLLAPWVGWAAPSRVRIEVPRLAWRMPAEQGQAADAFDRRGLAIEAGSAFVVNVLAERQRPLLARFGKPAAPEEDPFAGIGVGRAPCGAPTIHEAAAWLECRPVSQTAGGAETPSDHVIVLAGVTAAGAEWDVQPLVHVRKNGLRY